MYLCWKPKGNNVIFNYSLHEFFLKSDGNSTLWPQCGDQEDKEEYADNDGFGRRTNRRKVQVLNNSWTNKRKTTIDLQNFKTKIFFICYFAKGKIRFKEKKLKKNPESWAAEIFVALMYVPRLNPFATKSHILKSKK